MYYVCVTYYAKSCLNICCRACDSVLVTVTNSCCRLKSKNADGSVKENTDISIYPNPAKTNVTIEVKKIMVNTEIDIFDITGRIIWHTNVTPGKTKYDVDVTDLPKGIYFVKAITQGAEVYSGKLLLE
jgi:hypothetical protein